MLRRYLLMSKISIHAPRMRSDEDQSGNGYAFKHFNPRSPHEERLYIHQIFDYHYYFNPRSPHEERLTKMSKNRPVKIISIHAPRMRSDQLLKVTLPMV